MRNFRLNRRAVLRGAGSLAVALPWLEAMGGEEQVARAQAQGAPAKHFISVFQPGGCVRDRYFPTGTETAPVLSSVLAPLQPSLAKLIVTKGLRCESALGEQHQAGIIAFLTGSTQVKNGDVLGFSHTPSIDQIIAGRVLKGKKFGSLQMAVRWATGLSSGRLHPINCANFEDNADATPIPPKLDPQKIFTDVFGSLDAGAAQDEQVAEQKSILDYLDHRYDALGQQLGASDKLKLDAHLTKIRELETTLSTQITKSALCQKPAAVDSKGYNPDTGINSAPNGEIRDENTDALIPIVGKFFMDMTVMALACDVTGVVSLQWTDTEAKHTFPWLNLHDHHHFYQHDGGFKPDQCAQIDTWYAGQHNYLLQELDKVDVGGGVTLLDESVVYFGSELGEPPTHDKHDMPYLLAGKGGGLLGGRFIQYPETSHNNLLLAILHLFGLSELQTVGTPDYSRGVLPKLTSLT